jgi:ketosteroid isomerase-like protein
VIGPLAAAVVALAPLAGTAGPEQAVLAADASFDAALAARDPATFTAHVAEDAVFSGATLLVGRTAVVERWSRFLDPEGPTLRWKPTAGGVAPSGDLAWTTGLARYAWKQKGIERDGLRYVTVWRAGAGGRWEVVLDGSLEPVPPGPSSRRVVRTFTSRDGSLEGTVGTFERKVGERNVTGIFLLVRERRGDAWHTVHESEMPSGPG